MNNSFAPSVHSILNSPELFLIPVYQRSYVWTEYNWKTLWEDLVKVAEGNRKRHFIGSIILATEEGGNSSEKEWLVIDGQQRLTTLTILVAAVCHWLANCEDGQHGFTDEESEDIKSYLKIFKKNYLFKEIDENGETKQTLRLKPSTANETFFNNLLDPLKKNNQSKIEFAIRESLIYAAFNYFTKEVITYSKNGERIEPKRVIRLIEQGLERMQMVRIELDKDDDPQRIFDSINHLGFVLSESDLIRNHILQGLPNKEKRNEFHIKYWMPIENAAKDLSAKKEGDKDKVPDFFRHYLTMKLGKSVKERGETGVYEIFRDENKLPSLQFKDKTGTTHVDNCEKVLQEIKRFAGYYEKFLNPSVEKAPEIREQLVYLRQMPQVGVILPFLLQLFDDYENRNIIGKPTLIKVLELIQSYVVRCVFAKRSRKSYNHLWAGLYSKSFKSKFDETGKVRKDITADEYIACIQRGLGNRDRNEIFPSKEEVAKEIQQFSLYTSNRTLTRYILQRLEEKLRDSQKHDTKPDYPNLTIEHIFPQQAGLDWVGTGKVTDDEHHAIKKNYLHVLGNLTLTGLNATMGNKAYREKVQIGFIQSGLRLNEELCGHRKWDKKKIIERGEELSSLFFTIWEDIPQEYRESVESEAMPILDVESLTDDNGKPLTIKSALFGSIEILYSKKKQATKSDKKQALSTKETRENKSWGTLEELAPEKTTAGIFYHNVMKAISEGHEGELAAINLEVEEKEVITADGETTTESLYIVPWEREQKDSDDDKYAVHIKYKEMLENIQKAAKATDTAGKLKIKFA